METSTPKTKFMGPLLGLRSLFFLFLFPGRSLPELLSDAYVLHLPQSYQGPYLEESLSETQAKTVMK